MSQFTPDEQYVVFKALVHYREKLREHGDEHGVMALDSGTEKITSVLANLDRPPRQVYKPARDLVAGDVLSSGATVTAVDTTTNPGVVFVEGDYSYRFQFNHGDPVKVKAS